MSTPAKHSGHIPSRERVIVALDVPDCAAEVVLDGGTLEIEWLENGHVLMTGAWAESFRGEITLEDARALEPAHG